MGRDEFAIRVKRITDTFGDGFYTGERVKMLWNKVKEKDPVTFNEAIDNLIANEKSAPPINKIMQYVWDAERRVRRDRPIKPVDCDLCDSYGMISKQVKIDGRMHSCGFRCECLNGQNLSQHVPPISDYRDYLELDSRFS